MTPIFYEHNGGIAQLARASALQAEGQGFESPYLQKKNTERCFFLFGGGEEPVTHHERGTKCEFTSSSPLTSKRRTPKGVFFFIWRVLCDYLQLYHCNDIIILINEEENSYCVNC